MIILVREEDAEKALQLIAESRRSSASDSAAKPDDDDSTQELQARE
jgi:hypothetical protein